MADADQLLEETQELYAALRDCIMAFHMMAILYMPDNKGIESAIEAYTKTLEKYRNRHK